MSPVQVAVVGDRFMRPQAFVDALSRLEGADLAFRTMELPWPDEPMQHGYAKAGLAQFENVETIKHFWPMVRSESTAVESMMPSDRTAANTSSLKAAVLSEPAAIS